MALDINSIVLQPQPQNRLDLSGLQQALARTQQMAHMRAQLEEMRRRNLADEELRRQSEAGEMARANLTARLQAQRIQADREQAAAQLQLETEKADRASAQKLQEQKVAEYGKFSDQAGKLSQEEMAARAPLMRGLGMGVDYLGSADGMDSWRVTMDAEKDRAEQAAREAQTAPTSMEWRAYDQPGSDESPSASLARMRAMGHDTIGEQGTLDDPGGADRTPVPTADAYAQALAAMDQATRTGQPARGPDPEDYLGGVPRNVIDLGAIRAQTLSQLDPMMLDLIKARPEEYQESALRSARAVRRMRLNPADSAKAFDEMQRSPEAFTLDEIKAERAGQLELDKAGRARTQAQQEAWDKHTKEGEDEAKDEFYTKRKLEDSLAQRRMGDHLLAVLDSETDYDDNFIGTQIVNMSGSKGTQSDQDLNQILGLDRQTYLEQGLKELRKLFIEGGFTPEQKEALKSWIERRSQEETVKLFGFMDAAEARIAREGAEPEGRRQGWRNFMNMIPEDVREEYDEYARPRGASEPRVTPTGTGAQRQRRPIGSEHPASYYQPGQKMPADAQTSEQLLAGARAMGGAAPQDGEEETIPIDQDADYQEALANATAETGLDPDFIGRVVGGGSHGFRESGGDPTAKSNLSSATGLIQWLESSANEMGTTTAELARMTRAEQVPYIMKWMQLKGVTPESPPEDYALAVAAPAFVGRSKDLDAVVYSEGTDNWKANRPWWPTKDGGDITVRSILNYYGMGPGAGASRGAVPSKMDAEALELMRKLRE